MKFLCFIMSLTLGVISCQKSDEIQRQEEYEKESFSDEEQLPLESTDEMEYYRDVINEGELDNEQ